MVPAIERALGNQVVANRVRPTSRGYRLEDWRRARRRFDAVAHAGVRTANAVFVGDVRDCYASIRPGTVEHSLRSVGIDADVARRAMSVLDDLERRGVRGLPVGPWGSGVLANAVLHGLDRALASEGLEALRWVDDVVVFASSASAANRADEVFRRSLATLGLEPNESKTHMLDPEAARGRFIGDRISRADGGRRGMMRPP
jgi:hypothetical protein